MFGNFSQQLKNSTKPASTLLEMNAKTLELVSKQQTVFFSGLMSDSVKLFDSLVEQTELKGVIAAQSVYAESIRERLTSVSKTTYGGLSVIGKDVAVVMKDSLETATEDAKTAVTKAMSAAIEVAPVTPAAKPAVKKPAAKKAVAKKPVAKKAPSSKPAVSKVIEPVKAKPAKAEAPKQTVAPQATPPVIEKPVAKKAEPAAEKTTSTSAPSTSKAAPKKSAPKKTVAELSPADVKADSPKTV